MSNMDMIKLRECLEEIKEFCIGLTPADEGFIEDEIYEEPEDDPEYGHCSTCKYYGKCMVCSDCHDGSKYIYEKF